MTPADEVGVVDEALERFLATDDEYGGGLSNHGPMTVDALVRLGAVDEVPAWCRRYERVLEPHDGPAVPAVEGEWRDAVRAEVPSLLRGAAAAAGHGAIRTAHAVAMLEVADTAPRRAELARALAYWRRSYDAIERGSAVASRSTVTTALAAFAELRPTFGRRLISDRLRELGPVPTFDAAAIDDIVDAAAMALLASSRPATIALVHAVTTPVALQALAPYADGVAGEAWLVAAALIAAYADALVVDVEPAPIAEGIGRAVESGDEHAIKLAAACLGREDPVHAAVTAAVAGRL